MFRSAEVDLTSHLNCAGCDLVVLDNCNESNKGPMNECTSDDIKTVAVSSLQMKLDMSFGPQDTYTVNGWTEAEFIDACKNDAFYNSVKHNLQTDGFSSEDMDNPALRDDIILAKHHIAGASARWMFDVSTDNLLASSSTAGSVEYHMSRAKYDHIVDGFTGDRSLTEVNHLLSRIDEKPVIVSRYVATRLVEAHGEKLLQSALLLFGDSNPAMDGVLLEMDFILRLGRSKPEHTQQVMLVRAVNSEPEPVFPSGCKRIVFRYKTLPTDCCGVADGDWMVPRVFNNGGFDCVQYHEQSLNFVQVTRAATHSFKLKWYEQFRKAFIEAFPALPVKKCAVYFVVPDTMVDTFKPQAANGTLGGYDGGYKVMGLRRVTVSA